MGEITRKIINKKIQNKIKGNTIINKAKELSSITVRLQQFPEIVYYDCSG